MPGISDSDEVQPVAKVRRVISIEFDASDSAAGVLLDLVRNLTNGLHDGLRYSGDGIDNHVVTLTTDGPDNGSPAKEIR